MRGRRIAARIAAEGQSCRSAPACRRDRARFARPRQSTLPAVFVANNVSDGITTFTVNADGTLDFVAAFPTADGPQAIDLSPDGRHLAVAHGTANEVSEILKVDAGAGLIP